MKKKTHPKQPVKQGNNTALFVPHLLISFEEVFIFKVPLYVNIMLNCTVESPQTIAASKKKIKLLNSKQFKNW